MINIVYEFKKFKEKLPEIIQNSDFKTQYFTKLLDLKIPTYYRKLKDNSFTMEEIELITKALYPRENLLLELELAEKEYLNGNVKEHNELQKELRKEFI